MAVMICLDTTMLEYLNRFFIYCINTRTGKALTHLLWFINYVVAAGLGAFLYPLRRLLEVSVFAFFSLCGFSMLFLFVPIIVGATLPGSMWVTSIFTSVLILTAIAGLAIVIVPTLTLMGILRALIVAPIRGIISGWKDGLRAVIKGEPVHAGGEGSYTTILNAIFDLDHINQNDGAFRTVMRDLFGIDIRGLMDSPEHVHDIAEIFETASTSVPHPITEMEYMALQLPATEITEMSNLQLPLLTTEEVVALQVAGVSAQLAAYNNLRRLETDICPILQERPEREDTILLVKQYEITVEHEKRWVPIPGAVHIYSNNMLKGYCLVNAIHPINQDLIQQPSVFKVNGVTHQTRYIVHPYYVNDAGTGISQEVIQLTALLREHLYADNDNTDNDSDSDSDDTGEYYVPYIGV